MVASQAATPARETARRPNPTEGDGADAAVTLQHRRRPRGGARVGQSCAPAEVAGRSEAEGIFGGRELSAGNWALCWVPRRETGEGGMRLWLARRGHWRGCQHEQIVLFGSGNRSTRSVIFHVTWAIRCHQEAGTE